MDVSLVISRRLKDLGLEQKDLAVAAEVTESYISQLLARKKAPPAPDRTDIYDKIGKFLKIRGGELAKTGCAWWPGSVNEVMNRHAYRFSSFWIRTSSMCLSKIASRFSIR